MAKYLSGEFFQELVTWLNRDDRFQAAARNLTTSIMFVVEDHQQAFLLSIEKGRAHVTEATAEAPAEFKFFAPYLSWVTLAKGESELQSLVLGGELRFKGSLTKILFYQERLKTVADALKSLPKEF